MALQFNGKSSGTTNPRTRQYENLDDDKDWSPKVDDVEVSSRELNVGSAVSRYDYRQSDPVTDLKARLSTWGMSPKYAQQNTANDSDPNYPEDKRESIILDSSSFDDDLAIKEVEDSPYPEVRAAVHNYGMSKHFSVWKPLDRASTSTIIFIF
jgi:hypothetical protein